MSSTTSSPDLRSGSTANAETRLRALIARGFRFLHPRDATGEPVAVVGVRVHHNVVDVVHLEAEDDVVAMRVPGTELNVLAPTRTWWRSTGSVCDVLDDLLRLPDDRTPGAAAGAGDGAAVTGCWVPGGPGRATWLTAAG